MIALMAMALPIEESVKGLPVGARVFPDPFRVHFVHVEWGVGHHEIGLADLNEKIAAKLEELEPFEGTLEGSGTAK